MGRNYSSLEELRRKKELLKGEVKDLEGILTFKNTKESLSAFTNGLSDKYLQEKINNDGEEKTVIRKDVIAKQIGSEVKGILFNKNPTVGFVNSALGGNTVDGIIKFGLTALVANYAKKNMKSTSWKNKILGAVLIYIAPFALRYIQKRLKGYQKTKSLTSMEQLI